jgi:hypothetical protein
VLIPFESSEPPSDEAVPTPAQELNNSISEFSSESLQNDVPQFSDSDSDEEQKSDSENVIEKILEKEENSENATEEVSTESITVDEKETPEKLAETSIENDEDDLEKAAREAEEAEEREEEERIKKRMMIEEQLKKQKEREMLENDMRRNSVTSHDDKDSSGSEQENDAEKQVRILIKSPLTHLPRVTAKSIRSRNSFEAMIF